MMSMIDVIKQALFVFGAMLALLVVGWASYGLLAYPSLLTFISFFAVVPVFLILGLDFLKLPRKHKVD